MPFSKWDMCFKWIKENQVKILWYSSFHGQVPKSKSKPFEISLLGLYQVSKGNLCKTEL